MKTLRRYNFKDRDYFITIVTYQRRKILHKDTSLFWKCWDDIKPYAWVIMPDHFHAIINCGNHSISQIIHAFKIKYSRRFRNKFGPGRVWQNRFWDHIIRNQEDLNHHLDYIHYNPVKHGITHNPFDYEGSSLQKYYEDGYYSIDWGAKEEFRFVQEYGE
jgi:putative transposase